MASLCLSWIAAAFVLGATISQPDVDEELALATFDDIWTTVHTQHYDVDLGGVDWQAVRDELRPQAAEAADLEALRAILRDMLSRLGQSHFNLIDKEDLPSGTTHGDRAARSGGCGFRVRPWEEGTLLVKAVDQGKPAWNAGVRPGWLLNVDEEDRDAGLASLLYGPVGSVATYAFVDGDDEELELTMERVSRGTIRYEMQGLQPFDLEFESRVIEREGARIGFVRWSNWFAPMQPRIDRALIEMRDCDGIVLDLRGNGGGASVMVGMVAGHFFSRPVELGVQRMRETTTRYMAAVREDVEAFSGRLAILCDPQTGSASEVFSGGMQSVRRATIFGETTAGAVLPATTRILPNGDSLLYAIAEYRTAEGTVLEGRGVIPDFEVPPDRYDFLDGIDTVLDEAIVWLLH